MKNRLILKAGLGLLVLAVAACTGPGTSDTAVELGEFWITSGDRVLHAGSVELSVVNVGEFSHTLVVSDASGTVVAATDLIGPEAATVLTVDLQPGSYTFTCRIVKGLDDGTVVDHYQQGMAASVDVSA